MTGFFYKSKFPFFINEHSAVRLVSMTSEQKLELVVVPQAGALSHLFFLMHVNALEMIKTMVGIYLGRLADAAFLKRRFADGPTVKFLVLTVGQKLSHHRPTVAIISVFERILKMMCVGVFV